MNTATDLNASDPQAQPGGPSGPHRSRAFLAFKRMVGWVDSVTYGAIVLAMGLMTVIVSSQVFMRYVMSSSIDSADELSRLCFIWAIFLAIPHGVKHGVHVGIDLFTMMMPEKLREALFRIMAGCSTLLMIMVMLGGWVATVDRWPELMPTLPVTSAIYFIAVLVCGAHSLLHLALLAWGGSKTWEGELA